MKEEEQRPKENHAMAIPDGLADTDTGYDGFLADDMLVALTSMIRVVLQQPETSQVLLDRYQQAVLTPLTKHLKVVPTVLYLSFFEDLKREHMAGHALLEALYGVLEERKVDEADGENDEQAEQVVAVLKSHADMFVNDTPTAACFLGAQRLLYHHCACHNCTTNRKIHRHLLRGDDPENVVDILMANHDLAKDKDYVKAMKNPVLRTMQAVHAINVSTTVRGPCLASLYIGCTALSMRGWNFLMTEGVDVDIDQTKAGYQECGCVACQWHLDFMHASEEEDHTLTEILRMVKAGRDQGVFVGEHEENWDIFSRSIALHEKYIGPV